MEHGFFKDNGIPDGDYRCPSWTPMPDGKKNVVVLGCSHTWGVGHEDDTHWVALLSKHNSNLLRYWNLAQPGASADQIVRILYGTEKVMSPKIIIVCWPLWSRRERLDSYPISLTSDDNPLKVENEETDKNNFLKNVFFVEKFAEKNQCKTFHCFAQDSYHEHIPNLNVLKTYTIRNCWPWWDRYEQREQFKEPSLASDGKHYGVEHHKRFAKLFLEQFNQKLR